MDEALQMDGIVRCGRYAFGPNRFHYCGPDASREIKACIDNNINDYPLKKLLEQFKNLFPYLRLIATENKIADPFDNRVVEAYWLGNYYLKNVEKRPYDQFIRTGIRAKEKMKSREFDWLEEKIGQGALPHHSFHVFNVWAKTIDLPGGEAKALFNMDECRISSGRIQSTNGPEIMVKTEPLLYSQGKIFLGQPVSRTITRKLEAEYDIENLKPGQIISIHWSQPCEVITEAQATRLRQFTMASIKFANQTM